MYFYNYCKLLLHFLPFFIGISDPEKIFTHLKKNQWKKCFELVIQIAIIIQLAIHSIKISQLFY